MMFNKRKVLIEKNNFSHKNNYYGMKFCSYESNKESLLIVNFQPDITCELHIDQFDCIKQKFSPVILKVVDSIDDNGSSEFVRWLKNKINRGTDMFFYQLNPYEYCPILALRGCSVQSFSTSADTLNLSIKFFAYSKNGENC